MEIKNTHLFCIAHTDPLFNLPPNTKIICTGDYKKENKFNICHSKKSLLNKYKYTYGFAGTLFINEIIQNFNDDDYIVLMAYRKFISKKAYKPPDWQIYLNKKEIDVISLEEINKNIINQNQSYCFSHPQYIYSTIYQYNNSHIIQDFLRFIASAIDVNILNKNDFFDFIMYPLIIPGGVEIGKYPVNVYKDIVNKLEIVVDHFLNNSKLSNYNDDYQARAVAFCIERLSSWLLIQHLQRKFNKSFIKKEIQLKSNNNLIDKDCLNFNEYIGYLTCII